MSSSINGEAKPRLLGSLWFADPVEAHKLWRSQLRWSAKAGGHTRLSPDDFGQGMRYSPESTHQYEVRWRRFCKWLGREQVDIARVSAAHISAFLETLKGRKDAPASSRSLRTYLAEIDRVFDWLNAHEGLVSVNPAGPVLAAYRESHVIGPRVVVPPLGFLARYDAAAEMLFQSELAAAPHDWVPLRNLALRLIASECGLTLQELGKLTPHDVRWLDGGTVEILAPGHGRLMPRVLAGTARLRQVLGSWIAQRRLKRIRLWKPPHESGAAAGGQPSAPVRLFLAKQYRDATGEIASPDMSEAHIERILTQCVRLASATAGVDASVNGPRYVRTAFVVELLSTGLADDAVRERMGVRTNASIWDIRKVMARTPPAPHDATE
ncbi:site-specific integrase [Variovorax sp. RB2P76]|uniref:site-specific integrase n=1 Tax=Variovorax sp. RB2P76 TaxID=3443736 RepID=UPI003F468DB0